MVAWIETGPKGPICKESAAISRVIEPYTDYGRQMKRFFFHQNPKGLGLGRQFGQIKFGAFGVISAALSAPILLLVHVFYLQKTLYPMGFEFGPQRIRALAIVCP